MITADFRYVSQVFIRDKWYYFYAITYSFSWNVTNWQAHYDKFNDKFYNIIKFTNIVTENSKTMRATMWRAALNGQLTIILSRPFII